MAKAQAGGKKADLKPLAEAIINGKREVVVELVKKALADERAAGDDPERRPDRRHERSGPPVQGQRVLRAGGADRGARHVQRQRARHQAGRDGNPPAPPDQGGREVRAARSSSARSRATCTTSARTSSAMMLNGAGFEIIDLEIDVPPEKFVETAKTSGAKLIGLSALLTTTMPQMKTVIEARQEGRAEGREGHDRRRAGDAELRRRDRRSGVCSGCRIRRGQGEGTARGRLISGCRRKRSAGRAAVADAAGLSRFSEARAEFRRRGRQRQVS